MERKIRVLLAKPGLDGHDRGIKVVARALRDAGMEVIYLGSWHSVEEIVQAAIQEDVDVLGLSMLAGNPKVIFPKAVDLLKKNNVNDVMVLGGGIIHEKDIAALKEAGVAEIFGPGTNTDDIIIYIKNNIWKYDEKPSSRET